MIKINKLAPPEELSDLQRQAESEGLSATQAYNKLENPLKKEVRDQLIREQGHLCAYCMRRIPDERVESNGVIIEHWAPRNPSDSSGAFDALNYLNMLAVCTGNQNDKTSKRKQRLTCDAKKDNRRIKVNPLEQTMIDSISYKQNGEITSSDNEIKHDLNITLNLNCCFDAVRLPDNRKEALSAVQESIEKLMDEEVVTYCKEILSEFEKETDPKTPYVGIIIWWLKDFINSIE